MQHTQSFKLNDLVHDSTLHVGWVAAHDDTHTLVFFLDRSVRIYNNSELTLVGAV